MAAESPRAEPPAVTDRAFGVEHADVPASGWVPAAAAAAAAGFAFFDWLSGYEEPAGAVVVVCHLWAPRARRGLLLRTRPEGEPARLASLTAVFRGADWHERETFEMFGVVFDGHPHLVPLLLPDGFEGHPLRKSFVLAARVARPWPGAVDPAAGRGSRRPPVPPGVPAPEEWGSSWR